MTGVQTIEGQLTATKGAQLAIVCGRFNSFIVDRRLEGAIDALRRHGGKAENIEVVKAPGAFELPLVARRMASAGRYDAIIALGAVIRGGTPHFDYVAGECTKGLAQVSMEKDIPIAFGVLTVDTIDQAIERAGTKAGNKGAEAALSAVEMVNLLAQLNP